MVSLNPNELEIMRVLWEHGPQKPSEIQQKLSTPVKNSALRWQLGALVEKGQVTRRKKGKAYYYRAKAPRDAAFRKLTRRIADVFCGGSAMALIGELIESEGLSHEDVRELRRMAEKKKVRSRTEEGEKGAEQ